MDGIELAKFYKDKKVFVTGCTGFKGSWLLAILNKMGAKVCGYALNPPTNPSLFNLIDGNKLGNIVIGDVRDYDLMFKTFNDFQPEIVIHLAAQPIVIESYKNPKFTYETNVLGTVNILECVRNTNCVKSFINVTTDKVYLNKEVDRGYVEDDYLDGYDPYSNSKSCSELVTHCYKKSYFNERKIAISTARAGNVIGGGDFADNRIIPDAMRASISGETLYIRNPNSIRPYQHVLEPLFAYLMICKKQYEDFSFSDYYNVGPDDVDCVTTGDLIKCFLKYDKDLKCEIATVKNAFHEAGFLKLDCTKIKRVFGWRPTWFIDTAIEKSVEWLNVYKKGGNVFELMQKQIGEFING